MFLKITRVKLLGCVYCIKNVVCKQAAIDSAKYDDLKCDLASVMYKRAVGYEVIEEDQLVEERDGKTKKKVHRIKKQVGPDYKALVYLLTKHFGKEYGESYEELLLNEQKFAAKEVKWTNADEVVEEEEHEEVDDSFL